MLLDVQNVSAPITTRTWFATDRADAVPIQFATLGADTSADFLVHGCIDPTLDPNGVPLLDAAVTVAGGASDGRVFEWWPFVAVTVAAVTGTPDLRAVTSVHARPAVLG